MKTILLLTILILGCSKPEQNKEFYFSAAYPPYQCTDLNPYQAVIIIDGTTYTLLVKEVNGGLITERMELPMRRYTVNDARVYNKQGEQTHEMIKERDKEGWVVITTPFPIEVNERVDWISGQLFCK